MGTGHGLGRCTGEAVGPLIIINHAWPCEGLHCLASGMCQATSQDWLTSGTVDSGHD